MRLKFAAAAALALFASAASAATITDLGAVPNGINFGNDEPDSTSGTVDVGVTGSLSGIYADVYAGTDQAGETEYNSVQTGGSAIYDFSAVATNLFTIIWGTVDLYNFLTITGTGVGESETITGAEILALIGNPTPGAANRILQIESDFATIASIELTSTGNSFEHSINPAAVPVPAAGLLLVAALGGLGLAGRRRKA